MHHLGGALVGLSLPEAEDQGPPRCFSLHSPNLSGLGDRDQLCRRMEPPTIPGVSLELQYNRKIFPLYYARGILVFRAQVG